MKNNLFKSFIITIILSILLSSCNAFKPKMTDARDTPVKGTDRARKNIEEGKGVSIGGALGGRRGGTTYEFSTSNPMWRASLEILDFLPMNTVDYSGGMIISDWYNGENSNDNSSIKISIRFLSNEVRTDSLKIIVHKKKCLQNNNCKVSLVDNSTISQELRVAILKKAAVLDKDLKKK
jgi:hypothetical protein